MMFFLYSIFTYIRFTNIIFCFILISSLHISIRRSAIFSHYYYFFNKTNVYSNLRMQLKFGLLWLTFDIIIADDRLIFLQIVSFFFLSELLSVFLYQLKRFTKIIFFFCSGVKLNWQLWNYICNMELFFEVFFKNIFNEFSSLEFENFVIKVFSFVFICHCKVFFQLIL